MRAAVVDRAGKAPRSRDHAEPGAPSAPSRSASARTSIEALDAVRLVVGLDRRRQQVARLRVEDEDESHDDAGRCLEERRVGLVVVELTPRSRGSVHTASCRPESRSSSASTSPTSSSTARRTCSPSTCARSPWRSREARIASASRAVGRSHVAGSDAEQGVQPAERLAPLALVEPRRRVPLRPRVVVRARVHKP